jgi:hypothetical protein
VVEDEVALVAEGGAEAVKEGELVRMVLHLLLLHLHLRFHLRRLLLRQQMLWPQASSIHQQQEHDDKFSLQDNRVPIMMLLVVVVVVGVRVSMIHHPQGLVNDLRALRMFLMRVILVLMLLV